MDKSDVITSIAIVTPFCFVLTAGILTMFPLVQSVPAQEIGTDIVEWSVSSPSEKVPSTDGEYKVYSLWKSDNLDIIPNSLQRVLPEVERAKTVQIKILPSSQNSEFQLCMYQGEWDKSENPEIISYDSVTGEEVVNEAEVCS